MSSSAIKYPKRLFSQTGGDASLPARVITLENNEYKITYYEIISGASGSITIPAGATINAGEFGLSGNCILSKIDGSNKPTFESPKTAGGVIVTASLNISTGAWVASGTYTDSSVALIYSIKIKAIYYSNLTYTNIIETADITDGYVKKGTMTANYLQKADGNGGVTDSSITDDGVNVKVSVLTPSQIVGTDASKNLQSLDVATYPSLTELSYAKGVTSAIQTQLDGKLSSTKERLLDIVGFSSLSPADATTYYFGEMHYAAPPTGQSSYRFQLNENVTIARAIILVRLTTVPSNESISFYIRESATTDYTITTSLNANTITSNVSKSFIYSGLNIAITAGNNYEMKMVTPTWATNPTNFSVLIKLYGY